ncbi:MAG TPA: hypothetical protein VMT62_08460 [Syntrophorhabdaceae bacterium]|nr:hypothetical protein [Syntrophorhabdaceae bacterium]
MNRSIITVLALLIGYFLLFNMAVADEKARMETATGKVISVDPQGKAITITAKIGSETMDVGTIVDKDTKIMIKGKPAPINDIKLGDTVTVRYLKSDNLYAKEVSKK